MAREGWFVERMRVEDEDNDAHSEYVSFIIQRAVELLGESELFVPCWVYVKVCRAHRYVGHALCVLSHIHA